MKRERFETHPLTPAESATGRAVFHVAMQRPVEARALIDEARKSDPKTPAAFVAEGLLFDNDDKREQAKAAYTKAAELGSSNAYAHYRAAVLKWGPGPQPDQDTLKQMEKSLARAVALNSSFALAYARLAEVSAALGKPSDEVMPILIRAVELEPSSPWHRLAAARVLWRFNNVVDARKAAHTALSLADSDEARAFATFEQLCNGGLLESCAQWAVILASHPQQPDMAKARQLLTKSCDGASPRRARC